MRDIVLLHGASHGSWCWTPLLPALAATGGFDRIITLDMPGCGTKRGRDVSAETLGSIAAALNDELHAAGVRDAVLVGHSIAGILLPMMAVRDPELFSQLVYVAASLPDEGQSVMAMIGTGPQGADPDHVGWPAGADTLPPDRLIGTLCSPDLTPAQLEWLLAEVAQDVTPPALSTEPATRAGYDGRIPAAYILTLRDPLAPTVWQRRFAARGRCGTVVEIDTPHEPFISHPDLLARTLLEIVS